MGTALYHVTLYRDSLLYGRLISVEVDTQTLVRFGENKPLGKMLQQKERNVFLQLCVCMRASWELYHVTR